jgi:hypothetical protein
VRGAVLAVVLSPHQSASMSRQVGSARRTYAMDALARITLVCVLAEILTLRDVQGLGGDDLVERVRCAGEELACVAVTK